MNRINWVCSKCGWECFTRKEDENPFCLVCFEKTDGNYDHNSMKKKLEEFE